MTTDLSRYRQEPAPSPTLDSITDDLLALAKVAALAAMPRPEPELHTFAPALAAVRTAGLLGEESHDATA